MPDASYLALALGVTVAITLALRAAPFGVRKAMADSDLLADIGRWMPLGAVVILATYCIATIDFSGTAHGLPEITGVAVTVAVHLWRRNAVVSILAGTIACLVMANAVVPG
ncbi:branched-chain amino acid transporter permease [Aldersonia kunmingensis]|uniref:branched-chain amino acid transporter permease n=1 Tax=Aldersonia kunmingensis TaxID=408066 RepID=UPI00082A3E21|nr:AzlD domain-containing protein [Aldersonia kunmingensis]